MRKLLMVVAAASALVVGSSARAASMDIRVVQRDISSSFFDVFFDTTAGIGGVYLVPSHATAWTTGPSPVNVSALDSVVCPNGCGTTPAQIQLNGPSGGMLVPAGVINGLLGTLTGDPVTFDITNGDSQGGYTVLDPNFGTLDYTLTLIRKLPVPEPGVALLLGLGLAGVAFVRRAA